MSIRVKLETGLVHILNLKRLELEGCNRLCVGTQVSCKHVRLGYGARINGPAYFRGTGTVEIGQYAAIGQNLRVLTSNHEVAYLNMNVFLQNSINAISNHGKGNDIKIGPATWIGDEVTLVGKSIGAGAIVGAGSVVTKHVEPFSIVAGNPAKFIRYRFSEAVMRKIQGIRWWECNIQTLSKYKELFSKDLDFIDHEDLKCFWKDVS